MSEVVEVIYEKELFGKIFRVYNSAEYPLFLAKDVAEWLDYSQRPDGSYQTGQMLKTVDDIEKTVKVFNGKECWFLTEDGLYELLMQSHKPIAKPFKSKVKAILKEIRLTGKYIPEVEFETVSVPNFNDILQVMESWLALKKEVVFLKQELDKYKQEYERLANLDANNYTSSNIDVAAFVYVVQTKGVKISRNQIYKWLRDHGYIFKISKDLQLPYPQYVDEGLFEVAQYSCKINYSLRTIKKLMITPKGQVFFANAIAQDIISKSNKLITVHSLHS